MGGEEKGQWSRRRGSLTGANKQVCEKQRTAEAGGRRADRCMLADVRSEVAAGGERRATWEGDVSLYERTKIGHGCLGKISLGGVTRQLTLHLVMVGGGQAMVSRGKAVRTMTVWKRKGS